MSYPLQTLVPRPSELTKAWSGTLDELMAWVNDRMGLPPDRHVSVRSIRNYQQQGLLGRGTKVGKQALFNADDVHQLWALKHLLEEGWGFEQLRRVGASLHDVSLLPLTFSSDGPAHVSSTAPIMASAPMMSIASSALSTDSAGALRALSDTSASPEDSEWSGAALSLPSPAAQQAIGIVQRLQSQAAAKQAMGLVQRLQHQDSSVTTDQQGQVDVPQWPHQAACLRAKPVGYTSKESSSHQGDRPKRTEPRSSLQGPDYGVIAHALGASSLVRSQLGGASLLPSETSEASPSYRLARLHDGLQIWSSAELLAACSVSERQTLRRALEAWMHTHLPDS